ncbi:MAG: efflux RND transporter periplasmic adaptor subunit [Cyclobacteriaceae bacterium]|nr:efflux transporter periplasmic adaptor subunit [Cytophagales bacterium]HNP76088.1 efflux RND transporter periplasmic adaptor subunit [Cyclobacteriaceae bacterium]
MSKFILLMVCVTMVVACHKTEESTHHLNFTKPKVNGNLITFADDTTAAYFETQTITSADLQADFSVPARVVATVIRSSENPTQNLILFDNPDLTSNYTLLLQHLANVEQIEEVMIKQRTIELERMLDLQKHGAATGRDVLEAQTALALQKTALINEKSALLEHETMLKLGGFSTNALRKAKPNTVWVISEIAENQISKVRKGETCQTTFSSFPNEVFYGRIEDIGDVVDNVTRLLKLRIAVTNSDGRLKAGMFGSTRFGLREGKFLTVPLEALVTVQGKNYVFVRKSAREFERRAVTIGQQANNRMIVFDGILEHEEVVIRGTMQLKGLSFGY